MFPFARKHFASYLEQHWNTEAVQVAAAMLIQEDKDYNAPNFVLADIDVDTDPQAFREGVVKCLLRLMDNDVKTTGLKKIQGLVWQSGFTSGEMVAHVYDDVRPAIEAWRADGKDVRIYSSGSVHAQKLFFEHSVAGDMLPLFGGHYDTTTGPKKDFESYSKIAEAFALPAKEILFVSDIEDELDAAIHAGMQTILSIRPGNKPLTNKQRYLSVESFAEINV
jgi:enolase-phosphatase E1